ncbi:MAG: PulJ/GspJ family protein [Planctomycetota bacterium]|jgi:hypothetical protein
MHIRKEKPRIRKSISGITLLEVIIAIAILSFVLLGIYAVDRSARHTQEIGTGHQVMQQVSSQLINELTGATMQGRLVLANESSVTLQLPIDLDGDGDVLDNSYQVEWGIVLKDGTPVGCGSVTYSFVPASPGVTHSESAHNIDFNEDGDTADIFTLGAIHKSWRNGSDFQIEENQISPENILFTAENPVFSRYDDSGMANPDGDNVRIFLIVRFVDRRGGMYSRATRTTVSPRNPKQQ